VRKGKSKKEKVKSEENSNQKRCGLAENEKGGEIYSAEAK